MAGRGDPTSDPDPVTEAGCARDPAVVGEDDSFFRAVVESVAAAVVTVDETGSVAFANPGVAETFGYDPASLVGNSVDAILPDHERCSFRETVEQFARDGEVDASGTAVEAVGRHRTGEEFPVELSVRTHEHDGQRLLTAIVREIDGAGRTESDPRPAERESGTGIEGPRRGEARRRRERVELRRERDLTDQLLETVPTGLIVLTAAGDIERMNDRAGEILGVDPGEVVGESRRTDAWALKYPDGTPIPPEDRAFHRALESDERVPEREEIVEREDGETVWVLVSAAPMFEGDAVERVVVGIEDITAQKERERALVEEQAFVESVLDALPDPLYTIDEGGEFLRWNDRVPAVTGYDDAEIASMNALEFIAPDDREIIGDAIAEILSDETTAVREARVETKDGETIPYEFSSAPLYDEHGTVIGLTGVARDVSERKRRERRLREQNEQLERLDRINAVIRRIHQALVRATTRTEIDDAVCEALASADPYRFAWIGDVTATTGEVAPRATGGDVADHIDALPVVRSTAPDADDPVERAIRTRTVQVTHDISDDAAFESVSDSAGSRDVHSAASVPLAYEDSMYGVLTVYADESGVFDETERTVLAELGATIAHAINAVTTRQALVAERVTELTFRFTDDRHFITALSAAEDCEVTFQGATLLPDETFRYYVTVTGSSPDDVVAFAESFPGVAGARIVSVQSEGTCLLEMASETSSAFGVVAEYGGVVQSAAAAEGESEVVVEMPVSADVRAVVDALDATYDGVELVAQREGARSERPVTTAHATLDADLTERQRTALETAYYAGFFEWPRESTGEEVAETMEVSAPTFHRHLRVAERKLLAELFEREVADSRH